MKTFTRLTTSLVLTFLLLPLNPAQAGWMGAIDLMVREEVSFYFYETKNIEIHMYENIPHTELTAPKNPEVCNLGGLAKVVYYHMGKKESILCHVCFNMVKDENGKTTSITPMETSCDDKDLN